MDAGPDSDEEKLALAFRLQHDTIRHLEYALACMAETGGDTAHRCAYRLIQETLADLKAIAPSAVGDEKDLRKLYDQLKDCDSALDLSFQLISGKPRPRP